MPKNYVLHYAGHDIEVNESEVSEIHSAWESVGRGRSVTRQFKSGWTVLFTPGVATALRETPRPAITGAPLPALSSQPPFTGPAPIGR